MDSDKAVSKATGNVSPADPRAQEENQVRVNWDSTKMKTSYANVCNVSSTREEFTLLFGTNQTWQAGQRELTVELSDRVILNPFAAKRLTLVMKNVIEAYESRFGNLSV